MATDCYSQCAPVMPNLRRREIIPTTFNRKDAFKWNDTSALGRIAHLTQFEPTTTRRNCLFLWNRVTLRHLSQVFAFLLLCLRYTSCWAGRNSARKSVEQLIAPLENLHCSPSVCTLKCGHDIWIGEVGWAAFCYVGTQAISVCYYFSISERQTNKTLCTNQKENGLVAFCAAWWNSQARQLQRAQLPSETRKQDEREGQKGEQHPVSYVTTIKTLSIIYTGREEQQHLSPVCLPGGSLKDFTAIGQTWWGSSRRTASVRSWRKGGGGGGLPIEKIQINLSRVVLQLKQAEAMSWIIWYPDRSSWLIFVI